MKKQFEILRACRNNILESIKDLTIEQLQIIPKGFRNSIFWNVVHCMVIQQLAHYRQSGLELLITEDWIENYKKGSEPRYLINEDELDFVKRKFISNINQLEQDYNDKKFAAYTEYTTGFGVVLNNIDDAINYNNVHEGMHYGYILALKRAIFAQQKED